MYFSDDVLLSKAPFLCNFIHKKKKTVKNEYRNFNNSDEEMRYKNTKKTKGIFILFCY